MKIGISSIWLNYPSTGIGQSFLYLLKALAEVDQSNEYILLGPHSTHWSRVAGSRFRIQTASMPAFVARKKSVERMIWEQFTGPAAARKAGVDLLHIPYFAPTLLSRIPTIITIHDVIQLLLPSYRAGARKKLYLDLIARAARKASMIITISQHAKQDIVNTLDIPPERIRTTYLAVGDEFSPITDAAVLAETRSRYGLGERYILYLGGLDQRKNVLQVVRAFAAFRQQSDDSQLQLLIAGDVDKCREPLFPDPRPLATELGITDHIIYRFVEEKDKAAVYSGACLFVFPSLYEGFGLTPLEAMSCGTPVICSNFTSLPEIVGNAAISLDPHDTRAWVQAMESVLNDPALQADLRARGLKRAAQFTWHKSAAETVAVYEEALARSRK